MHSWKSFPFPENSGFLWCRKQDRVFSLETKKYVYTPGNESGLSMKIIGGYPCSHSHTGSHPERTEEWCTLWGNVHARPYSKTPATCSIRSCRISQSSAWFASNLSTSQPFSCRPWAVSPNTLKSFRLIQGTIKLPNGHNHYVKGGLYCQQFEYWWLPESADKMSGAQYFKAIKLSAFLSSLITF